MSRAQSPVPFFPTLAATNRACEPLQAQEAYASWRMFVMDRVTQVTWAQREEDCRFYSDIHREPIVTQLALNRNFIWNGEMSRRAHRAKPQDRKTARLQSSHGLDSPRRPILSTVNQCPCPIARSILPCLPCAPCLATASKTVWQSVVQPPQQTVPSLPPCKVLWQYQESQVAHAGNQNSDPLQTPGHDRHPQGLLKQPEPSACLSPSILLQLQHKNLSYLLQPTHQAGDTSRSSVQVHLLCV